MQNSYGQRVSWKSPTAKTFFLHTSIPTKYDEALRAAVKPWEDLAGHPLINFERMPDSTPAMDASVRDGTNVISMTQSWNPDLSYQQAVTSIYWTGNIVTEADIVVDGKFFKYFYEPEDPTGAVHFASLLLHEFGHALGLKHSDQATAVMWPFLSLSVTRMTLTSVDQGSLKCEY